MLKPVYFEKTRKKFQEIKKRIESPDSKEKLKEFERALEKLLYEYDTANWENRFVVGGALEILFCALLNSLGFKTEWLREPRYDINIDGLPFSLKSNFTSSGDIRLINILGEEKVKWEEPTLFFISELGICYLDPEMNLKTKHTSDALTINVKEIKEFIEKNKRWNINISIPRKKTPVKIIKTASYDVVKSLLEEIDSKFLKNHLPKFHY